MTDLDARIRTCVACPELVAARQHVVVGHTPPGARVLFVGEAPGATEDAQGIPFVGKAGQVLDAALAAAGSRREDVAILNVLKCRPPGNRRPLATEIDRCRGWLEAQISVVDPVLIVPMGLTSIGWFIAGKQLLREVRGRVHEVDGRRLLPTYHPSGALRYGPSGAPMQALYADVASALSWS